MLKLEKNIFNLAFLIFFFHGGLYLFFPDQHYLMGGGGWIVNIKYIIFFSALFFSFLFNPDCFLKIGVQIFIFFTAFIFNLSSIFYWSFSNPLYFQYLIPMVSLCLVGFIFYSGFFTIHSIKFFLWASLILSLFSLVYELFFFDSFGVYSRSGFRAMGIYANPNNSAIIIAFFVSVYLTYLRFDKIALLYIFFSIVLLIAYGSKTGFIVLFAGIFLHFNRWQKIILFPIFLFLFLFLFHYILNLFEMRELSLDSGIIRLIDASDFFRIIQSWSFIEILFGAFSYSIVDNSYLDLISFSGLIGFFIFLLIQVFSIYLAIISARRDLLIFHMLFIAIMLTTNVIRLWPLAYIYWAIIGWTFFKWKNLQKGSLNV